MWQGGEGFADHVNDETCKLRVRESCFFRVQNGVYEKGAECNRNEVVYEGYERAEHDGELPLFPGVYLYAEYFCLRGGSYSEEIVGGLICCEEGDDCGYDDDEHDYCDHSFVFECGV